MIRSPILHNIISNFSNSPSKLIFPDNQINFNKLMGCGSSSDLSVDSTNNKVIEVAYNNNKTTEESNKISIQENSITSSDGFVHLNQTENHHSNEVEKELIRIPSKIDYDSIKKKLYENNESINIDSSLTKEDCSNSDEDNLILDDSNYNENDELIKVELQSLSESNYNDELLLDFETFILLPSIQEVLLDKSATLNTLKELFDMHDKDNDGQVNDKEREDLLELINLSYSSNSPYKVKDVDNNINENILENESIDQVSSLDIVDDNTHKSINNNSNSVTSNMMMEASEPVTPRRKPMRKLQHSQSVAYKTSDLVHITPFNNRSSSSSNSNYIDKDDVKKSYEDLRNRIMPIRAKSENLSKSKLLKINTSSPDSSNIVIDSNTRIPTQKRGFMMKHDSQESAYISIHNHSEQSPRYKHKNNNMDNHNNIDNNIDNNSDNNIDNNIDNNSDNNNSSSIRNTYQTNIHQSILSHNRFFVLDKGYLSYMDSTSKKPPFSLNNRELLLKGMCLKVDSHHNIIELTPTKAKNNNNKSLATTSNNNDDSNIDNTDNDHLNTFIEQPSSSYCPSNAVSLYLEVKNASEFDDWIDAFEEHIKFSDSIM